MLGQVGSGRVRSGCVRSGCVRSGRVRSGWLRSGQVMSDRVPPHVIPLLGGVRAEEFMAAAESGVNLMCCSKDEKQDTRMRIVGAFNRPTRGHNLTTEEAEALAGLRKDSSIVILSSDKGRSTVVLDKSEYEFKAVTLLQDTNTYEVVEVDPTQKLQRKVHKEGVPLRPIIAFRGSPTYNLAKALAKRLRPLVEKSERMLKNSTDFVDRLRGISLEEGDILVSFDVKSMFTSLPQDLLKQAVLSKVEGSEEFRDNEKLSTEELVRLVNLCLDSTFFRFREKVYHQRIGTPMGSPISVVLAEMAMQEFEEEMLAAAPVALKTWMRYVDDVFVIMKEGEVDCFLNFLNGRNTAIQLLDYESCHPVEHKKSVVKTLWSRAGNLCSTEENLKEERKRLEKVFADNGYPKSVIRRWTTAQGRKTTADTKQAATRRITLPYVKGASEVAARLLRKRGVEVAHKPANSLHGALTKVFEDLFHVHVALNGNVPRCLLPLGTNVKIFRRVGSREEEVLCQPKEMVGGKEPPPLAFVKNVADGVVDCVVVYVDCVVVVVLALSCC
ncbi:uncharacterized protein LOC143032178 [Oratosquilla oratoria]|uniref:uncharacterized protein LOC143032178 n=1 Tax=Oratosquilla oratoria TaxID=337810 RepID=UPI003F75DA54